MVIPVPQSLLTYITFSKSMKKKKKSVKNHLEIMLNLINIRQTVTIKFRVGIKSVSQKWKIMGKLMHDISEGKTI